MGDPLTALGLVANIAQFIDYGRELFNTAKSIYDSASGFERETETCHALTVDLRTVCDKLIAPSPTAETEYEVSKLRPLALRCAREGDELIALLEKARFRPDGSRWDSFRAALVTFWNQDRIDSMNKRLDSLRLELILQLNIMARYKMT